MSKKLYVGNLPFSATDSELNKIFSEFGTVEEANVIMDTMMNRSRGFGFVTMADDAEASQAIEKMNGTDLGGRPLVVNEARPKTERAPRRDNRY